PALEVARVAQRTDLAGVYEAGGDVHVRFHVGTTTPRLFLGVYDVRGRLLRVLSDAPRDTGEHLLVWNERDASGAAVARGIYVVALRSVDANATRKVALLGR
ncbi:MAG TPA: hypothetical protein VFN38_11975, partial [Gemmatimonadaceae bacterium]|nr:hypothetical protein [Gemmatimonadaceae bacterium]